MRVDLFDFDLPQELIALRPAVPRDSARLLVVSANGTREHRDIRALPQLLRPGDVLVLNDSKVIPARLHGLRHRTSEDSPGAKCELLLYWRIKGVENSLIGRLQRPLWCALVEFVNRFVL